jgi:adenosylhomocysteine nucleosidase
MSVAAMSSTWLIVASEARELAAMPARSGWLPLASGPGSRLVSEALRERRQVGGIVSTGFCGALDPTLEIGDIIVAGAEIRSSRPFVRGEILSADRVAVTVAEKRALREHTGAIAVEMESAAVAAKAREWGVPFRCIKVVSDSAREDMPLDFNRYRDDAGHFSRGRIAVAALRHPFTAIPGLLRLDRNCRKAAEKLGEFLADCQL